MGQEESKTKTQIKENKLVFFPIPLKPNYFPISSFTLRRNAPGRNLLWKIEECQRKHTTIGKPEINSSRDLIYETVRRLKIRLLWRHAIEDIL